MRSTPISILCLCSVLGAAQPAVPPGHQPVQPQMPAGHPEVPAATVEWPAPKPGDVDSIDAILAAMYAAPAGDPGQAREWDRYRALFVPDARMIAARPGAEGSSLAMYMTIGSYIDANRKYFEKGGFHDKEVARRVQEFGNIAHVWSTFESRQRAADPQPYVRGINSIQLLNDGTRWWIVNIFWEFERPDRPIPERFLTSPPA